MRSAAAFAAVTALLAPGIFGGARSAHADLTIVAAVTRIGQEGEVQPETSTAYFKGDRFRQESNYLAYLTDCASGQVQLLDLTRKRYWATSIRETVKPWVADSRFNGMKIDVKFSIKKTATVETIAGRPSRKYTYTAKVKAVSPSDPSANRSMMVNGDAWLTDSLSFPSKCITIRQLARQIPGMPGNIQKVVAEKLAELPGYPLRNQMVVQMDGPAPIPHRTLIMTTEVKSVSGAPLAATLFSVPAGWQKEGVPAPGSPGGFRGPGGPRGFSGGPGGFGGFGGPGGSQRPGGLIPGAPLPGR